MKHSPQIEEGLNSVAPLLAKTDKTNVFILQDNYFDLLCDRIMDQVTATSVHQLPSSETLFSTPQNYFSNFPGHLMARIKELENNNDQEEIEDLSPLLTSLKSINVFSVDPTYFLEFNVKTTTPATMVRMHPLSTFWKYASAAAIAGIMAVSALLIENYNENGVTGSIADELRLSKNYQNIEQLNSAIKALSSDDIVNYLDQSSTQADETDLANSIMVKELPSTEEYLLDENTLNEYLSNIDLKSSNN